MKDQINKYFQKFTSNDDDLAGFIDFLATKVAEKDVKEFRYNMARSIKLSNKFMLQALVNAAKLDLESLRVYEILVASGKEGLEADLYHDLVFIIRLPKDFNSLNARQRADIENIYSKLFGIEFAQLTSANYSATCSSMRRILFDLAVKDLFPDETESCIGDILSSFGRFLGAMLDRSGYDQSVIDQVSIEVTRFLAELGKQNGAEPKIKSRMVSKDLAKLEDDLVVSRNEEESSNDAYIVINKARCDRYYVKSFDEEIAWEDTLNPCEMFIYKVMEYMGYGPETEFLVEPGENILWARDVFENNFILTKDVRGFGQEFFSDTKENEANLRRFAIGDGGDIAARKFAVEISAMAALANIVPMDDVFGVNGRNYGIVGDSKKPSYYSLQFIDHWPSRNGLFTILTEAEKRTYSPRSSLSCRFFRDADGSRDLSPLAKLAEESRDEHGITKNAIQDDVYQRLFSPQGGSVSSMGLLASIAQARHDVEVIFLEAREDREDIAEVMGYLDEYIAIIRANIETYYHSIGRGPSGPGAESSLMP